MSGEPQGLASFPGVTQILSASYCTGHGISPGRATITMASQLNFVGQGGDLVFTFAGETVAVRDCKVDYASFTRNERGEVWSLSIMDRRWKWRNCGSISGAYNRWRDNFTLRDGRQNPNLDPSDARSEPRTVDTERTPQQLAELCLEAMGESDYDVSALPEEPRPTVEWDYDNPAEALASLCEDLGCRVTLDLNGNVKLVTVGVGNDLPSGGELENSYSIDPPEKPDEITVVCGPTLYGIDFELEAVGWDVVPDGAGTATMLKPIDDLSYTPRNGWKASDLDGLRAVGANTNGKDTSGLRELAVASVFKFYRIKTPLAVSGWSGGTSINKLEQILPIFEHQAVPRETSKDFQWADQPALVFGVYFPRIVNLVNSVARLTPPAGSGPRRPQMAAATFRTPFYLRGFTIDAARGLVIFEQPVYRNTHSSAETEGSLPPAMIIGPATLRLRAACNIRDETTLGIDRYERTRHTGASFGSQAHYIVRDEIVRVVQARYSDSYTLDGNNNNQNEVDRRCDKYLDAALAEYEVRTPQQKKYPGIIPIELDGAIHQVIYEVGASGATTTACRNSENLNWTLSFKERRRIETARQAAQETKASKTSAGRRRNQRDATGQAKSLGRG